MRWLKKINRKPETKDNFKKKERREMTLRLSHGDAESLGINQEGKALQWFETFTTGLSDQV